MRNVSILAALTAVALSSCAPKNNNVPIEAPASVLEALPGNYTLKTVVDDSVRYSTAVVTQIASDEYQISRVTVYGPVLYGFKLGEHAAVESPPKNWAPAPLPTRPASRRQPSVLKKEDPYANCQNNPCSSSGHLYGRLL